MAQQILGSLRAVLLSLAMVPNTLSAANYSCANLSETKAKLYAVMRGYQCEQSQSLAQCRESLGIGKLGAALLGASAAGAMGRKIVRKFQNPEFVLCPLGPSKGASWKQPWSELLLPTAWAACTHILKLQKEQLRSLIAKDLAEIKQQIAQANEAASQVKNRTPAPSREAEALQIQTNEIRGSMDRRADRLVEATKDLSDAERRGLDELRQSVLGNASTDLEAFNQAERQAKLFLSNTNVPPESRSRIHKAFSLLVQDQWKLKSREAKLLGLTKSTQNKIVLTADEHKSLGELEEIKKRLEQSQNKLEKLLPRTDAGFQPPSTEEIKDIMANIASSGGMSANTQVELLAMDSHVNSLSSVGFGNGRWNSALPQQVRFTGELFRGGIRPSVAKVIGGLALSSGAMSAAQAAEVGDKMESAMDAMDIPTALIHSENLGGGDCGMEVPSPYFPFDVKKSCNYNVDWNDRIQARVLHANDAELAEVLKERGVCEAINKNFERFYPKPKGAVNCSSSPLRAEVADGASFTINEDYISITGSKGERVGFYPDRSGSGHFSIAGQGTKESLSFQQLASGYPKEFSEYNRLKAVALSVQSCCNQHGTLPPEKECQRYGIQTGEPNNYSPSTSDSGNI